MMKAWCFFLSAAFLAAPALAQDDQATPVKDFLIAADKGDQQGMAAAMDPKRGLSAKKLFRKIEGCYLRRVYNGPSSQMIASWMCADGENKSRVILADVSRTQNGAQVEIASETKNDRPAPARSGSAFGGKGS